MGATLKKPRYLLMTLVLSAALFALYIFFDLRQGGTQNNLFNTHLTSFPYLAAHFGAGYVYGEIALDLLVAILSAMLIAFSIDNYRSRTGVLGGSVCSTAATVLLGFTVFSCPSCVLPIAGTLGALITSQALPFLGIEFKLVSLLIILLTWGWLLYRVRRTRAMQII